MRFARLWPSSVRTSGQQRTYSRSIDVRKTRESQVALVRPLSAEEFRQLMERTALDPDETTKETFIDAAICP